MAKAVGMKSVADEQAMPFEARSTCTIRGVTSVQAPLLATAKSHRHIP